jgi:Zn-dependent protease with chaperone function
MKKLMLSMCATAMLTVSGCTTFADMAGADSATLNAQSAQGFAQLTQEARAKNQLDTSSSTYQRINTVFQRLKPYADQLNQTGQRFDWKLAVLKSDTVNAYVAPGGKVVFYTGIVNKLNLTNDEIAAVMGHEMTHALEEHSKSKIGAQALTNLAIGIGTSYAGANIGEAGNAAISLIWSE